MMLQITELSFSTDKPSLFPKPIAHYLTLCATDNDLRAVIAIEQKP